MRMNTQKETAKLGVALLCACVAWTSGCYTRRAPVKPPVNFIAAVHPVLPAATDAGLESPPDLSIELPEPPQIGLNRMQPPKPHVAAPPTPEPSAEKHVEPTITPEVTTEELTAAKTETQRDLDMTEKNLSMVQGKKLNPTQEDLASKVRGFADNAKEAMRSGDWVRARSLSKKAELLSEQLAASL
jgi:type IV secretory pathway VirB10-like protein